MDTARQPLLGGTQLSPTTTAILLASKARATQSISEREEEESIRMRDCRNMLGLIDAVQRGKLDAELDAQRAGYFGGSGLLVQIVTAGFGLGFSGFGCVALVLLYLGQLTVWQFIKCGLWWSFGFAGATLMRAFFLRKLQVHRAFRVQQGAAAAGGAGGGGSAAAVDEPDRCSLGLDVDEYCARHRCWR
jgi:hypothetical protein